VSGYAAATNSPPPWARSVDEAAAPSRRFLNLHDLSEDGRLSLALEVELKQLIVDVARRSGAAPRHHDHHRRLDDGVRLGLDRINSDPARARAGRKRGCNR
jgi:hypothetical protein